MTKYFRQAGRFVLLASFAVSLASCAALGAGNKVKKAPCGPTAGMTDPCGNAVPINSQKEIDSFFAEELRGYQKV